MPVQKSKSAFDFNKSLQAHAADTTDYGQDFSRLPGGISGGIAKLNAAKLGVYKTGKNAGQQFFRAAGVVLSPKTATDTVRVFENGRVKIVSVKEVPVQGLQTSIMIPLCDTEKGDGKGGTVVVKADEHISDMMNELRKLGGEDFTSDITSEEELDAKLEALVEAKPVFRFGTWSGDPSAAYPTPRVLENWYGTKGLDNFESNGQAGEYETAGVQDSTATVGDETPPEETGEDLAGLAVAADNGEAAATARLTALAKEAGISKKVVDNAADWGEVVALIAAAGEPAGTEEAAPEPEKPWEPAVEEIYLYHPINPKTRKPVEKGVEVEVTAVDKKTSTVSLKNLDNPKVTYKAVKWADLESPA